MKTKRLLAAVLLCILPLAACATHTTEEPPRKSQAAATSPSSEPAYESPERNEPAYLVIAEAQDMALGSTEAELVELGDAICDARKRGMTDVKAMSILIEDSTYNEAAQIYAAATTFLCPEINEA